MFQFILTLAALQLIPKPRDTKDTKWKEGKAATRTDRQLTHSKPTTKEAAKRPPKQHPDTNPTIKGHHPNKTETKDPLAQNKQEKRLNLKPTKS